MSSQVHLLLDAKSDVKFLQAQLLARGKVCEMMSLLNYAIAVLALQGVFAQGKKLSSVKVADCVFLQE